MVACWIFRNPTLEWFNGHAFLILQPYMCYLWIRFWRKIKRGARTNPDCLAAKKSPILARCRARFRLQGKEPWQWDDFFCPEKRWLKTNLWIWPGVRVFVVAKVGIEATKIGLDQALNFTNKGADLTNNGGSINSLRCITWNHPATLPQAGNSPCMAHLCTTHLQQACHFEAGCTKRHKPYGHMAVKNRLARGVIVMERRCGWADLVCQPKFDLKYQ